MFSPLSFSRRTTVSPFRWLGRRQLPHFAVRLSGHAGAALRGGVSPRAHGARNRLSRRDFEGERAFD